MRFILQQTQPTQTIKLRRPFSHVIRIDGLKSGLEIPVECAVMQLEYRLLTPRRLKILAGLKIVNGEIELQNGLTIDGIRIYWKNKPRTLPENRIVLQLEHVFEIPQQYPAARRIISANPSVTVQQATTLTNRLVVKGELYLAITYQPR